MLGFPQELKQCMMEICCFKNALWKILKIHKQIIEELFELKFPEDTVII